MEYINQDVRRQDRLLDEARAFEILKEGEFGILSMRRKVNSVSCPCGLKREMVHTVFQSTMCGTVATPFTSIVHRWDVNCAALMPVLTCLSVSPVAVKLSRTSLLRGMKASYCNVRHTIACTKQSGCLPSPC